MTRCSVPGCPNWGTVVVPVGPDMPRVLVDNDGEPYFDDAIEQRRPIRVRDAYPELASFFGPDDFLVSLDDPTPTYVTGRACPEHIEMVRAHLRERHQPYAQRIREGRP